MTTSTKRSAHWQEKSERLQINTLEKLKNTNRLEVYGTP